MARLYKGSTYRESAHTLTLRPPTESGAMGAAVLRDGELLEYCRGVIGDLAPAIAQP